jgi:hypothetical protein
MPIPADVLVATKLPSFARDRGRRDFAANFETALISIDPIRGAADRFGNTRSDAVSDTGAPLDRRQRLLRAISRYPTSQGRFATGASYPRRG